MKQHPTHELNIIEDLDVQLLCDPCGCADICREVTRRRSFGTRVCGDSAQSHNVSNVMYSMIMLQVQLRLGCWQHSLCVSQDHSVGNVRDVVVTPQIPCASVSRSQQPK